MPITYLTVERRGDVAVVAVRRGLFDEMPEMGEGGPRLAELVGELKEAELRSPTGAVLDVRAAGEINKRTLAGVFSLARTLTTIAPRCAVCGTPEFVEIWEVCRGGSLCPAFSEMSSAENSVNPAVP